MAPAGHWRYRVREDTLGELMNELPDKETSEYQKCYRLRNVMANMEIKTLKPLLLERFHPSYYAVMPDWGMYQKLTQSFFRKRIFY